MCCISSSSSSSIPTRRKFAHLLKFERPLETRGVKEAIVVATGCGAGDTIATKKDEIRETAKMSDSGDHPKYKWTPESSTLLVSIWTDKQVQKQFEYTEKPQLIWESIARYMKKKGYNVTSKQCRSRMKQVLVCYREAKRAGTRAGVEQYYESIDKVLKNKKLEQFNINGIDTVDSMANVKSPPKDVKTNKNLQMRYKYQEPMETLLRTEALSPMWPVGHDEDYPDSPESNETVLAQPYRAFSPTRNVATNTNQQLSNFTRKTVPQNISEALQQNYINEAPIRQIYHSHNPGNNNNINNHNFNDPPNQNSVQNVQNQIIQETMQQHHQYLQQHNFLQSHNPPFQQIVNVHDPNQVFLNDQGVASQPQVAGRFLKIPNGSAIQVQNQAVPQVESRKPHFRQNLSAAFQQQYQEQVPSRPSNESPMSQNFCNDECPNLNEAFCQSKSEEKVHNMNETFEQRRNQTQNQNQLYLPTIDSSGLTNNATFNDDTLSIEFLQDSPSPSDNGLGKLKDFATNTEDIPNAPFRKKKAQKLEQLMLNAINCQNEVVNKILAAQSDMVNKFIDIDRDRQNRLENRLDHLLNVVHATVLNKSPKKEEEERDGEDSGDQQQHPVISNLLPPPKPGVIPPKLDLVPPKPCRVPCTVASGTVELINHRQNQEYLTKPGVVSPPRKVGQIWSKLGPVSQSPFVRAQQQLGLRASSGNCETRTQSSAERRIARMGELDTNFRNLVFETNTFIENEKLLEEKQENARRQTELHRKLKLYTSREPTAGMILSAALIEAETRAVEDQENARILEGKQRPWGFTHLGKENPRTNVQKLEDDDDRDLLLAGQGESYERLKQLKLIHGEPCDSSTPAKPPRHPELRQEHAPKQTIQQLAQLVMNSARWRNPDRNGFQFERKEDQHQNPNSRVPAGGFSQPSAPRFPLGFTSEYLNSCPPPVPASIPGPVAVLEDKKKLAFESDKGPFQEIERYYLQRNQMRRGQDLPQQQPMQYPFMTSNGNQINPAVSQDMIERCVQESKQSKDKDTDSEDEYLDTTGSLPTVPGSRRGSLTSNGGNVGFKFGKEAPANCVVS